MYKYQKVCTNTKSKGDGELGDDLVGIMVREVEKFWEGGKIG